MKTQMCIALLLPLRSFSLALSKPTVAIAGATGYIGRAVVDQCLEKGFHTIAICREGGAQNQNDWGEAEVVGVDVSDPGSIDAALKGRTIDCMISCLASRSGSASETELIDYQSTVNCLDAGVSHGMKHFVLLSAFCNRKPKLYLHDRKLRAEAAVVNTASKESAISYSIVRPTAYFKSVDMQVELMRKGFPYISFGDGTTSKCNPIAKEDLAEYMINTLDDSSLQNKVLNIGGPDTGYTKDQQGWLMGEVLGVEPSIWHIPFWVFAACVFCLEIAAKIVPSVDDSAELARIQNYYAYEDMLTTEPHEKFGRTTLRMHYQKKADAGAELAKTEPFLGSNTVTWRLASLLKAVTSWGTQKPQVITPPPNASPPVQL